MLPARHGDSSTCARRARCRCLATIHGALTDSDTPIELFRKIEKNPVDVTISSSRLLTAIALFRSHQPALETTLQRQEADVVLRTRRRLRRRSTRGCR